MADKRVITVFGATGNQGGAVARSLAENSTFQVRGLTRNPNSDSAQALQKLGITPVKADGWDGEQLTKALEGSWGLFVNTNSEDPIWRDGSGRTEFDLGKIIVDSAVAAGVKHIVYSSAGNPVEQTDGKFTMHTMMMKNKIERYIRSLKEFETGTFINAGWYMELFKSKEAAPVFGGFPYFPDDEGYLTFVVPNWGGDNNVPWLNVNPDYGDMVHGIFLDPARWNGTVVHGASHLASFDLLASSFQKITGKEARYKAWPSWETWDDHGVPALQDVRELFGFMLETGGRYMGPDKTDITNAATLKKAGAAARGETGSGLELSKLDRFFEREFAPAA